MIRAKLAAAGLLLAGAGAFARAEDEAFEVPARAHKAQKPEDSRDLEVLLNALHPKEEKPVAKTKAGPRKARARHHQKKKGGRP